MAHTVKILKKPELSGVDSIPDGAFCGNGDLGAVLGNSETGVLVYITKCDFWLADERCDADGGISPIALLYIDVPKRLYDNYYVEQRMDSGELFLDFKNGSDYCKITLFCCAVKNAVMFKIDSNVTVPEPRLLPFACNKNYESVSREAVDGVTFITRTFSGETLSFTSAVAASLKCIQKDDFGEKYILYAVTNHDNPEFYDECRAFTVSETAEVFNDLQSSHYEWWRDFYSKSSFRLSDGELENAVYASLYSLAVCARNNKFPPGIYGNFITKNTVNWKGDYHLNYNYQAPFYALCAFNHAELTDCYCAPLEAFIETGREFAKKIGCDGIYYPVGLAPLGLMSERPPTFEGLDFERLFLGQKSNAVHAADILVFRWNLTRDTEYAKAHIYPYLKECAAFWESYLVCENGIYNIYKDAIHEIPYYREDFNERKYKKEINSKNNLLTIGLLKMLFSALVDISAALSEDADKREKWLEIYNHLPAFPTQIKRFKRVFRYTEKGMAWNDTNFLCLQHVYPAGAVDASSDEKLLKIARNTFFINDRFDDGNAGSSVFPCAVRLRISPKLITDRLRETRKKFMLPNTLIYHGGGCLENCSVAAATLGEMALSSSGGVIEFFPDWDNRLDCEYKNFRVNGAFLVSSSIECGTIKYVSVTSEKGGELVFKNPYEKCVINGKTFTSTVVRLLTAPGETIEILRSNVCP